MDSSLRFLLKFGEKDHIEEFASGILYCSNAVTFWGIEDKLKIKGQGDILEAGVKTFAQRMAMQENETGEIALNKELVVACNICSGAVAVLEGKSGKSRRRICRCCLYHCRFA